ncbi:MAG: hypothetical protein MdMp024_1890 [Bacteroidales bacterium]
MSPLEFNSYYGVTSNNPKDYGIFFDHFASIPANTTGAYERCDIKMTVDFISGHDGTSMTILMSENLDAGHWIWKNNALGPAGVPIAYANANVALYTTSGTITIYPADDLKNVEPLVAFCYPPAAAGSGGTAPTVDNGIYGDISNYISLLDATYATSSGGDPATDYGTTPLFINEGRSQSGAVIYYQYRKARPSSNHPGIVVAAFADRSTRYLRDDMDKALFVRLCRTNSGTVLNPKDLD